MPFTDETTVRRHSGLHDTEAVPTVSVERAIEEAHHILLVDLDPSHLSSGDDSLKLGETELAGAILFRALAGEKSALGRDIGTIHLRVRESHRHPQLLAQAEALERRGMARLRRFLAGRIDPFAFRTSRP